MPQDLVKGTGEKNGWLPENYCFLCNLGDRLVFNIFVEQAVLELLWRSGQCTVAMPFWHRYL